MVGGLESDVRRDKRSRCRALDRGCRWRRWIRLLHGDYSCYFYFVGETSRKKEEWEALHLLREPNPRENHYLGL